MDNHGGGELSGRLDAAQPRSQSTGVSLDPMECGFRPSRLVSGGKAGRHFYGRRRGRSLGQLQSKQFAEQLRSVSLPLSSPWPENQPLAALFDTAINEVWLEIGFGGGEHLVEQLRRHPDAAIIGAEPFVNGVSATLTSLFQEADLVSRVKIHGDDGLPIVTWLPPASISRAFMLFPDPWPKKRHWQRRLLSRTFLDAIAPKMKEGGEFRFASDSPGYVATVLALASQHPAFELSRVWQDGDRPDIEVWPETRYEGKARRAGRTPAFLFMTRKPD